MHKTLIIGPVFCDLLLDGYSRTPEAGEEIFLKGIHLSLGGAAITATALAMLGVKTGLLSFTGLDPLGQYLQDELTSHGIDTSSLDAVADFDTSLTLVFPYENDRGFITRAMEDRVFAALVREKLGSLDFTGLGNIHLTFSLLKDPRIASIIRTLSAKGIEISLDLGYEEAQSWTEGDFELLRGIDYFMPNEKEIRLITGEEDLETALRRLQEAVTHPMVTLGEKGAAFLDEQGGYHQVPSLPTATVNTTGAGDSFSAGFLYGRSRGLSLRDSVRRGVITGSLTAGSRDSVSPEISQGRVEALMR